MPRFVACHFHGTKSIKTERWCIVCAILCRLSRISYELFTKCVTPNDTRVHLTSCDNLENFLNISKFSQQHGTHYFTWPTSPLMPTHAHCHQFFFFFFQLMCDLDKSRTSAQWHGCAAEQELHSSSRSCPPTHTVTSSSLVGTPNCARWRKPFAVPVWGLLNFRTGRQGVEWSISKANDQRLRRALMLMLMLSA